MPTPPTPADAELLATLRAGGDDAYGELFRRHHAVARRYAHGLVRNQATADEVTSEAFTKVLNAIRNGHGPVDAFRPYLFAAVRSIAIETVKKTDRNSIFEIDENLEIDDVDLVLEATNRSLIAQAYAELPERWRSVLWHLEVEDLPVTEVGVLLGMKPNAVSALAFRAREALRIAYLNVHLSHLPPGPGCKTIAPRLARYVRGSLPGAEHDAVEAHLATCPFCPELLQQLSEVESVFHAIVGPAVLAPLVSRATGWRPRRGRRRSGRAGSVAVVLACVVLVGVAVALAGWLLDPSGRGGRSDGSATAATPPLTSVQPSRLDSGEPAPKGTSRPPMPTTELPGEPVPPADSSLLEDPGPVSPAVAELELDRVGEPGPGADTYTQVRVRTADPSATVRLRIQASGITVRPVSTHGRCRGARPMTCWVRPVSGTREAIVVVRTSAPPAPTRLEVSAGSGDAVVRGSIRVGPGADATHVLEPAWVSDDGAQVAATGAALGPHRCAAGTSVTSAALDLPPGSTVRWARAYWYAPDDQTPGAVTLHAPGNAATPLLSFHEDRVGDRVQRSADVTHLIRGAGTYRVAPAADTEGAWTLVVAYLAPDASTAGLTVVYDLQTPLALGRATTVRLGPSGGPAGVGVVAYGADGRPRSDTLVIGDLARRDPFDSISLVGDREAIACGYDLEQAAPAGSTDVMVEPGSAGLTLGVLWRAPRSATGGG